MYIPAWKIANWGEVCLSLSEWDASVTRLRHLGTSAHQLDEETGLRYGQALWGVNAANDMLGLAWDWKEVRPGVVAMSDPMTILSNAVLIDDGGSEVDSFKRILHLNNAIYLLPWQQAANVRDGLKEPLAA